MQKKILIIKTGSTIPSLLACREDFEDWFIQGSAVAPSHFVCSAVDRGDTLPQLDKVAGIIITGSAAFITDLAPWNAVAADYLRQAHECKLPILGVCYGHQLLAWAFGGELGFHPKGREIGTVDINLSPAARSDALFAELPASFKAQASHLQSVLRLPQQAVLLASNAFETNHAFRLGESTWGVQFHPEFSARVIKAYIRERNREIAAEGLDVEQLLAAVENTATATRLLQRFVAQIDLA